MKPNKILARFFIGFAALMMLFLVSLTLMWSEVYSLSTEPFAVWPQLLAESLYDYARTHKFQAVLFTIILLIGIWAQGELILNIPKVGQITNQGVSYFGYWVVVLFFVLAAMIELPYALLSFAWEFDLTYDFLMYGIFLLAFGVVFLTFLIARAKFRWKGFLKYALKPLVIVLLIGTSDVSLKAISKSPEAVLTPTSKVSEFVEPAAKSIRPVVSSWAVRAICRLTDEKCVVSELGWIVRMTNKDKGKLGELVTDKGLGSIGLEKFDTKLSGDRGIDGLFRRQNESGLDEWWITESKVRAGAVDETDLGLTKSGQQMSQNWIESNLEACSVDRPHCGEVLDIMKTNPEQIKPFVFSHNLETAESFRYTVSFDEASDSVSFSDEIPLDWENFMTDAFEEFCATPYRCARQ